MKKAQRYILNSNYLGRKELSYEPEGWDSQGIVIARDPQYHGIFEEVANNYRFVKDGMEYIQGLYEEKGIHEDLFLLVYELDENEKYQVAFKGKALMDTYRKLETFVEISFIELSDINEIRNIENRKIDLLSNVDKWNNPISSPVDRRKTIAINGKTIVLSNSFLTVEDLDPIPYSFQFAIPFRPGLNESNFKSQGLNPVDANGDGAFWRNTSQVPQSFNITYFRVASETVYLNSIFTGTFTMKLYIMEYVDDESDLNIVDEIEIAQVSAVGAGMTTEFHNWTNMDGVEFTLQPGQFASIALYNFTDFGDVEFNFYDVEIYIDHMSEYQSTSCKVLLPDEVFTTIFQHATGKRRIFYSEFFGRTDSEYFTYAANGPGALTALTNGKNLRGFEESIYATFKELFHNYSSLYNLGMGVEMVNGEKVFRIEKAEHFYSDDIIYELTADDLDDDSEISKEFASDFVYSDIRAGYAKWNAEDINNLDEPNAVREFKTWVQKIDNTLDIQCSYIAGCYAIEFTRRQNINEAPNKSWRFDNDNFFIVLRPDYSPEYASAFDQKDNLLFPDNALNMRITPARTLANWGPMLLTSQYKLPRNVKSYVTTGGLVQKITGQGILEPVYHEGNNLFVSKWESENLAEVDESKQVDIINQRAIYLPEFYTFRATFTRDHLAALRNNRKGKIVVTDRYGSKLKGYVWRIEGNLNDKKADYILLRSNG